VEAGNFDSEPDEVEVVQSSCRADASGVTGSTTIVNGTLDGVALPANPAPNTVINVAGMQVILNEQILSAGGELTVNAIHIRLLPPLGSGDIIIAQSRCGVTTGYALPTQVANLSVTGSVVSFRLAAPARVRFSLDRRVARNRFRRLGTFSARARRGRNRVRIPRRLNGRRVGKGVFRLSARAVNSGGRGVLTRRVVRLR
jgi:hypothetical protein